MNKSGRDKDGKYLKGREVPEEEKEKISQGLQGNTNKLKLKTEELQKKAYEAYCQWLSIGRGKQGFVFDYIMEETGKEDSITWATMEKYIKDQRFDLNPLHKERAESLGYQTWENTGIMMMQGQMEKCQPAIYQMMMRNKYGWDKETKVSHVNEADAKKFMKFCDEAPEHENNP